MAYYIQGPRTEKYRELLKLYTTRHCENLLRQDPEAVYRLFEISQDQPVKTQYVRRKHNPPLLSKAAKT